MRFNLRTLLYGVAVLAAGIGVFGGSGWLISGAVLGFWWLDFRMRGQERNAFAGCLAVLVFVGLGYLITPDVGSRPIVAENSCRNNLRQIAIALSNYHDVHGTFPPPFVADDDGKPMHSWRVLILPYLERPDLYGAYDFNEPWDGPNNRRLANVTIDLFQCISDRSLAPGETTVFAIVGPDAAWTTERGRTLSEFVDGTDDTLFLIEARGRKVNWLEPQDLTYEEAVALLTTSDQRRASPPHAREHLMHHSRLSRSVATPSSTVVSLPIGCHRELAEGLLTVDGGEPVGRWQDGEWATSTRLHWPRIWGLAVFALLALLPVPWADRQSRQGTLRLVFPPPRPRS